jgi:ribonucleoside-diphosphate reductase alpha chain
MKAEEYFNSQIGLDIWNKKYRHEGESFDAWLDRVSACDDSVRELIKSKKFMFAGRILANRGIEDRNVSMSNCYVVTPPEDNLESIYETAKKMARTYSYGGGCGTSLSNLAPKGAKINNAAKFTSGATSFAELYDKTTELIGQDGRRGALMLSLSTEHPDIHDFINVKTETDKLTKCNISVEASDEFMANSYDDKYNHPLRFKRHTGEMIYKDSNAHQMLKTIAKNNHEWSEPGMIFIDRMANYNLMEHIEDFKIKTTNPCGEVGLPDGGACLLGSINLAELECASMNRIPYTELDRIVTIAVYALNDVLYEGIPLHPLEEQQKAARKWGQIGLGIMGYADWLIKHGLTYGSDGANKLTEDLMKFIINCAVQASAKYAKDNNCALDIDYDAVLESEFAARCLGTMSESYIKEYGLANSTILSIAPNGTISTMLGVSGGIEPHFALNYKRKTESLHGEDKYYDVDVPIVEWYNKTYGKYQLPEYFVTSSDINYMHRIKTQGVFQKYVDSSISSTVNLPNYATIDDVYNLYVEAWKHGLKGVTVHRSGNKREGVLTVDDAKEDDETISTNPTLERGDWAKKPADTLYYPHKVYTGCGQIMMQIGYSKSENKIIDFWIKRSGKGGCERSLDNIAVAMSGMLRLGGNVENIQKAFSGINACNSFTAARILGKKLSKGGNCGNAMLNKLLEFQNEIDKSTNTNLDIDGIPLNEIHEHPPIQKGTICPECGAPMMHSGGCVTCVCGYSKCD